MSRRFHANAKEISRHPGPLFSYSPLAHTSFYYSVSGTYTLSGYSRGPRAVENEEPQDPELEAKCTENKYKNSRILESENQQERRERGQELSLFLVVLSLLSLGSYRFHHLTSRPRIISGGVKEWWRHRVETACHVSDQEEETIAHVSGSCLYRDLPSFYVTF
jgi:hypothetical protein